MFILKSVIFITMITSASVADVTSHIHHHHSSHSSLHSSSSHQIGEGALPAAFPRTVGYDATGVVERMEGTCVDAEGNAFKAGE